MDLLLRFPSSWTDARPLNNLPRNNVEPDVTKTIINE